MLYHSGLVFSKQCLLVLSWFFFLDTGSSTIASNDTPASYCDSNHSSPLSVLFTAGNKVYFGESTRQLFTFDLTTLKHGPAMSVVDHFSVLEEVRMGVHFDPYHSCATNESNVQFCEHSKVIQTDLYKCHKNI